MARSLARKGGTKKVALSTRDISTVASRRAVRSLVHSRLEGHTVSISGVCIHTYTALV